MFGLLFYILLIIDVAGMFILFYSLARVSPGPTRRFFLFFMIVSLFWINSMYLVQLPTLDEAGAELVSRMIFAFGILAMHAYGYFVIYFCDRKEEFRSARFFAFMINQVVLLGLLAAGKISAGIIVDSRGLRGPVYGPAHPWFVVSWILWGLYVFAVGYQGYRHARDPVFRFQIKYLFFTGIVTFVFMVASIGLLPHLTRVPFMSYAGGFSCLILFWGIINLLVNERSLFIRGALRELLKRPAFRLRENVRALYRVLYTIGRSFDTGDLDQQVSFALAGNEPGFSLRITRGGTSDRGEPFRKRVLNLFQSEKYISGLIESQKNAQKENLRLALKVEELTRILREQALPGEPDPGRLTDNILRVLAAEIDPTESDLKRIFDRETALGALSGQEFNELILAGFVEELPNATFRLAEAALRELERTDDRPLLERILQHYGNTTRTHAPRWHLADHFAASGGGCARVLEIVGEDALGEPEEFKEFREFRNVALQYGYQGSEISLCETREPHEELLKAVVYDIFIGDGTYQFDCFFKGAAAWTKIRIEFVPGLMDAALAEAGPVRPPDGIFLLEKIQSSFLDHTEPDDRLLTVAVREQYRKLGSLGGRQRVQLSFHLDQVPEDFVLYIGTGRTLKKIDLEQTGINLWEGAASVGGLFVRAVLSTENMADFGLVVTRDPPATSAN